MEKAGKNAVAVIEKLKEKGLTVAAPSPVLGVEGMDARDAELPRIQLMQEKNKVLKAMRAKNIPAKEGQMFNSADESKPLDRVEFVPGYMTRYFDVFEVKGDESKWLFRTFNENDPRLVGKRWDYEEGPGGVKIKPEVLKAYSLVAVVGGIPTIIKLAKSSRKVGAKFYTSVLKDAKENGAPLWAKKYALTTKEEQRGKNAFYVYVIEPIGAPSEDETQQAQQIFQGFKGKQDKLNAAQGSDEAADVEEFA